MNLVVTPGIRFQALMLPFPNCLDHTGRIRIKVMKQMTKINTKLQATACQKEPNLGIQTKLSAAKAA